MSKTPLRELLQVVKADPEGCPIWDTDLTVQEVRDLIDNPGWLEGHSLTDNLDEAQGSLIEEGDSAFLVIRIRRA